MSEREPHLLRCAILLGPPHLSRPLAEVCAGRRLICTVGATPLALEQGCVPEAVLGSPAALDARARQQLQEHRVRTLTPADPFPEAALELGLNYAITTGARDILLLGMVGDSLADSLTHILLLARAEWGAARLTFIHGDEIGHLLRHGEAARVEGGAGTPVVLLPLSPTATEITTQGLEPALRSATLELGRAARLTVVEPPARVWLGAGRLLVIHTPRS